MLAAQGSQSKILETRKTAPGLRVLDKWAVLIGGGVNHRIGLFDMVMIKNNHITAAGSIEKAVRCTMVPCLTEPERAPHTSALQTCHVALVPMTEACCSLVQECCKSLFLVKATLDGN